MSVQDFFAQEGFVSVIPVVRVNKNGYPFITCVNASNEATNMYFASNIAANYPEGTQVAKGFFADLTVFKNESGYWRFGSSNRLDVNSLF
jgi:hypothetical protein